MISSQYDIIQTLILPQNFETLIFLAIWITTNFTTQDQIMAKIKVTPFKFDYLSFLLSEHSLWFS